MVAEESVEAVKMSRVNLQVLDYLSSKGVRFAIGEDGAMHGGYFVGREEIEQFLDDPDKLFAKFNGVSKSEYRDWREAGKVLRCAAKTKSGKPCKLHVENRWCRSAQEWLARQGEYCPKHLGGTTTSSRG
jgi:hypothetical protein